jgi:hypothetical protein
MESFTMFGHQQTSCKSDALSMQCLRLHAVDFLVAATSSTTTSVKYESLKLAYMQLVMHFVIHCDSVQQNLVLEAIVVFPPYEFQCNNLELHQQIIIVNYLS